MSEDAGVRNEISGAVHNALQAGTVHGDAYLGGVHHHHTRQVEWPCRVGVLPPRAHCFQQRDLATALTEVVSAGSTAARCQLIIGLGGVGKTQLAAEFARQRSGTVDLLVWITAGSREAIVSSYAAAARKVGQSASAEERDDEEASRRFLEWLATTDRRWLIVLDDVQNPAHLRDLWPPQQPTGQVVVTSRRQDSALIRRGRLIEVGLFSPTEATGYLHAVLAQRPELAEGATALAAALDCLPLALAQAAAYLIDRKLTCAAYLQRFADRRKRLHELVPDVESLPDDHHATLATTWSLSVELADHIKPAGLARPLLDLASVLDSNGIPAALFSTPVVLDHLTAKGSRSIPVRSDDARDALHSLNRLSLAVVDLGDPNRSVRVHALVQRATRDRLPEEDLVAVARAAADALLASWPEVERDTEVGQVLRTNVDALHAHTADRLWHPGGHRVLYRAGNSRGEAGLAAEAAHYFQHLQEHATRILGPDHPHTLATRSNLATWRGEMGDTARAVAEFEALFADESRSLGRDHPHTLATRSNLATWRGEMGDTAGTVTELETLLSDHSRVLGPDHPNTFATRNELAIWRGEMGNPADAVAEFEALLSDELRVLGPDHPDTLAIRSNLAVCRGEVGNTASAVTELEALLIDESRVLGPDHPGALATRNNLATWRGRNGDTAGAVAELEALLTDQSRVLGPDHPHTLKTRNNLATWRGRMGDRDGAVTEHQALLTDQSRVLGPDHPHTLTTRNNLAAWRSRNGDTIGVAELEAIFSDRSRVLGPSHRDTLIARNNLARWRGRNGDTAGAVAELELLLTDQSRVLGPDHPDTLTTRNNLATWRNADGDTAEAR